MKPEITPDISLVASDIELSGSQQNIVEAALELAVEALTDATDDPTERAALLEVMTSRLGAAGIALENSDNVAPPVRVGRSGLSREEVLYRIAEARRRRARPIRIIGRQTN